MINAPTQIPTPIYGNLVKPENLTEIFPNLEVAPDNILSIFQSLSLQALGKSCLVSKDWNRLANDPWITKMVVFQAFAFNSTQWNTYCGKT